MNNISKWNNICKTCGTCVPLSNSSLLPLGSVIHTTGKKQKHGWYKTIKIPQIFISGAGIFLPREFPSKTAMKQHHDHVPLDPKSCSPYVLGKDSSLLPNLRKYKQCLCPGSDTNPFLTSRLSIVLWSVFPSTQEPSEFTDALQRIQLLYVIVHKLDFA